MADAAGIVATYFPDSANELVVGGGGIGAAAAACGTPVFVYDRGVVERKLSMLQQALPPSFSVYYSIKANPNQAFLKLFVGHGCGLEIASGGELHQAIVAGCDPRRIVFAGPGKTAPELRQALEVGIGEIHVESMDELDAIERAAREFGSPVDVSLRINPGEEAQGGAMRMGGKPTAFGFDEEMLDDVLEQLLARELFRFRGVHLFTGTQILDHSVLIRQYEKGLEIAERAARLAGRPLEIVDFGGGLGVPYYTNDSELDLRRLGEELSELMDRRATGPEFDGTQFIVEPGRYLVSEAGVYVTRVTTVKKSRDKTFVVVDGGMNHHLAASGNLGQVIKRNYPVAVVNKLEEPAVETVDVVGPLCTPLDVLARGVKLPAVVVGDLIGIFQSGAYARSASPLGFLGHPTPPEVMACDGQLTLIRRRGELAAPLEDQCDTRIDGDR
jgi:diaminopimelate decarboxylase